LQISGALVPCVSQFIKKVDLADCRIDVELIEGMRPGETAEEVR
jgi:ribosomal 30S subunit maturation factor RimM